MNRFIFIFALILGCSAAGNAKDIELDAWETKDAAPANPLDGLWSKAHEQTINLMPQTIAPPGGGAAGAAVKARAIMSEDEIAVRLDWADATVDDYPSKSENFPDAAALQFPAVPATMPSPFMGDGKNPVVIWRWSASAQKDLDSGYQGSSAKRPRITADLYAYADDATFRTGEGAGNILSNRRRVSPVESLAARGFGTLTVQDEQLVQGKGVWKDGRWYVVFRRDIRGLPGFWRGSRIPFAVGVWNGRDRERDGIKSVSIWQTLVLPEAGRRAGSAPIARGRRVYQRFGCGTCHGVNAEGGVANPNAQTNPIPGLTKVREGYTREELQKVIFTGREPARKDPLGAPPPFKMNAWKVIMDQREADDLVQYLFSLQKEEIDDW